MNFLITTIFGYLLLYKYVALFVVTFIAALILPLPANLSIMAGGAFAQQGNLSIYLVIFVALLGNIFGDLLGFFVSRMYGKQFLIKIGLKRMLESKKYIALQKYLVDRVGFTIFITRFTTEFGPLMNILMGLSNVPFREYLFYELLGEICDVLLFAFAGYILGTQWQGVSHLINFAGLAIIFVITAIMVAQFYFKRINQETDESH